jgi:hypothetical protein
MMTPTSCIKFVCEEVSLYSNLHRALYDLISNPLLHRSSLKSKDTKSSSLTSTTATRFSSACIEISGTVLILMNLIYCVVSGTIYRLACVMLISCSVTGLSLFLDTTFDPQEDHSESGQACPTKYFICLHCFNNWP